MKTLFVFVAMSIGLSQASAGERTQSDRVLSAIAVQASGALTNGDFVKGVVTDLERRKEIEQFLKVNGDWDEKMAPLEYIGGSTLAYGERGTDPVLLKFTGPPNVTMNISGRVINLTGRSISQINEDVEAAIKALLFPSSAAWLNLALPFANASLTVGPRASEIAMVGKAASGPAWVDPPAKEAGKETLETSAEFRAIVEAKSKFEEFSCETKQGQPTLRIKTKARFFGDFLIEDIKADSDADYTLKKRWNSDMASDHCSYKVVDGAFEISKNPNSCDYREAEQAKALDKFYAKKPAPKKSAASAATRAPAMSVTKMLPGIPVNAMIACCRIDSKCHEKVKVAQSPDRGAKASGAGPLVR